MSQHRYNFRRKIKSRRQTRVTIPPNASPHVRLVFAEMARQNVRYDDVEDGSGVLRTTVKAWRHKNAPGLTSMEAVLGFLGWDLLPIPRAAVLPPALLDDLKPLVERHGVKLEASIAAFMGIAARERGTVGECPPFVGRLRSYPAPEAASPSAVIGEGTDHVGAPPPACALRPAASLSCAA